jgi:hypothetical protein
VEAVFRLEIFPVISDQFLPESTGTWQEFTGKVRPYFWPEYCFHVPAISRVLLQDMVTFPHIPWSILRDPGTGMFDLGFHQSVQQHPRSLKYDRSPQVDQPVPYGSICQI